MKTLFVICWLLEFPLLAVIISENLALIQTIESAALPPAVFLAVIGLASKHWDSVKKIV